MRQSEVHSQTSGCLISYMHGNFTHPIAPTFCQCPQRTPPFLRTPHIPRPDYATSHSISGFRVQGLFSGLGVIIDLALCLTSDFKSLDSPIVYPIKKKPKPELPTLLSALKLSAVTWVCLKRKGLAILTSILVKTLVVLDDAA